MINMIYNYKKNFFHIYRFNLIKIIAMYFEWINTDCQDFQKFAKIKFFTILFKIHY